MSAPEDTSATAKSAPDHHQNVVPPSSSSSVAASVSSASGGAAAAAAAATGGAGVPVVAGSGVPSAATVSSLSIAAPTGSGTGATNGSNISNSVSESEETAKSGIKTATLAADVVKIGGSSSGSVPGGGNTLSLGAAQSDASSPVSAGPAGDATSTSATSHTTLPKETCPVPVSGSATASSSSIPAVPATTEDVGALKATTVATAPITCSSSSSSLESVTGHPVPVPSNGGSGGEAVAGPSNLASRGREAVDKHQTLEYHCRMLEEELQSVKDSEAKVKQQYIESQRRERFLARRLAVKEQEMQDYANQIAELKSAQAPGPAALRSALLDPAVNILFQKLKAELQTTKAKLEETQNELSAWKFTPDSNTGKRLMAKCRLLYQENEELGKMTSNGRLAKLENELALQKSYNEEVKKSQLELDDFLQELDEDVEGMQSTIVFLQQELKQTKDSRDELEKELTQLRAYVSATLPATTPTDEQAMQVDDGVRQDSRGSYHHRPEGDGGVASDSGVGSMGGGITPIYLVNGGGTGTGTGTVASSNSRLVVNKSSSGGFVVGGDQDVVYNNRTHGSGVSSELRTTPPPIGSSSSSSNSSSSGLSTVSSLPAASETSVVASATSAVNGGGVATVTDATVAAGNAGGDALVNELKDPLLPAGGESHPAVRTSGNHNPDGNTLHSVNSASQKPQQRQQQAPHNNNETQQQQRVSSNNGGRNGGRTTVAARKRNYNDTEADSAVDLLAAEATSVVGGGGESGVHIVDGVVTDSGSTVANGKLLLGAGPSVDSTPDQQQQFDAVEANSAGGNKRMTRSGKGKVVASSVSSLAGITQPGSVSSCSSSTTTASSLSTNALMTSAAKKLRRGSVTMEEEVDPLADTPQQQQQPPQHQQQQSGQPQHLQHHTQQTISSANGSN
ncbi:uncharacterized protein LOC131283984 [Anopheles ziemanni]|uniref:uncharacterized protein LOC131259525 n=1 Tax=Anopheles coustani TaxID=139045 RepID=UPI002659023B|nr:uncharacterized protein LOC131259525 [Anopheles coustani]XP_058117015.1 uncharacterized protein LOC131259525 [Anopheles coustani]XP_058168815.1 uncharacterized protein LOC131283984 [Anopheles ziemanni]